MGTFPKRVTSTAVTFMMPAAAAQVHAAGMARRLDRPLLIVYVTSPGVYCEPMTGQVVGLLRDADSLERWLLAELDLAADSGGRYHTPDELGTASPPSVPGVPGVPEPFLTCADDPEFQGHPLETGVPGVPGQEED